jgi:short-subunit dehydrogenase
MTKTIIITGASSGLGKALASNLAGHNVVLHLIGRNVKRLMETVAICQNKGATVFAYLIDVSSLEEVTKFYDKIRSQKIDMVFAAAAVSMESDDFEDARAAKELFEINVIGVSNIVLPAVQMMKDNKRGGKIVIIGSIAGEIAFPSSPSYVASKAALKLFAHGLSVNLKKHKILVSMVLPGYIKTAMTQSNKHYMPMIISANEAAKIIIKGALQNKPMIIFPKTLYYCVQILKLLPRFMLDWILHKLPKKG